MLIHAGWAVPFFWAFVWGIISTVWVSRQLKAEREEWEADDGVAVSDQKDELGS